MKTTASFISLIAGILAAIFVFTSIIQTEPVTITLCSFIGVASGLIAFKKHKTLSALGIAFSLLAFIYLILLFAGLAL